MNFIAYPTYPTNRTNTIPTPRTSSKRQKKNTGRLWLAISHTAMLSAKKMPPTKVVYVTQTPVFPSALQTALMQA
jgi:hypothetical protein